MEDPDAASPQPETPDPDPTSLQEAMQDPINVWLGPVGPLLRKLHSLTASGHSLPDGLSADEIDLLRDGLKKLCAPLQDMSEDEVDASVMARWWMKIVRELCYDTEDHLDEVVGAGAHLDFSEFLARVKDASTRRERFQWWTIKPADSDRREAGVSRLTSPELPAPICGRSSTVGVAEPPKKLVDLLALDDDDKQTLKVISISGCAGVGKTTAARTLYHKHAGKFQCRAFVTVSRNPDTRGFLASMLSQLKAPRPHGFPDVPDLIDAISKHLQGKRYFIVIDDLWLASIWNIISRAFPRGDYCSRIISTTQIDDVALACCSYDSGYIYMMEPLNDHESRKLFFGRVFGSEDGCPTDILEVSDMIIRKCGGLPLAIVHIASLLACESSIVLEKWKHVHDSLPSTSEGMKDFLNLICNSLPHLIYSSLPPRLRTCLLYLSMYPQGYVIKKDELVKLWVAEGFLSVVGGRDTQEIAEGYFAELVSRGMVQVVDTNNNGEVFSCTVHQMVLDYIRHKSMEKNFVITVDYFQSTVALSDKVRRLSVQFGGVKSAYIPETIVTSQVRSLIFWGFFECVPSSIKDYGLLRVLILHIWADEDNKSFDLTGIGELFLLKYLKIECNITVELPDKIQGLQHLETLEVYAKVVAAPSDIGNMKRLLHLCLPSEYIQPSVVAHMTSLRTLRYFDLSRYSVEDVLHLGELTNLQDLQLTSPTVQPAENLERNVQLLGSILEKLSVLQSVTLVPAASGSSCVYIPQDGFSMASPPTQELLLRRIELSQRCCIFFSLPEWFVELRRLCILKIAIRRLSMNDTDMLKGLPALTALTLYIQTAPADRIVIKKEGFQVLTYFKFICAAPCVSFVPGAMPKVQKLKLGFNSNRMKQHSFRMAGLRFLRGLTEFSVKFGVEDAEKFDIKAAESVMEAAIWNPPNTPIMRVRCVDVIFCEEDKSTATEEIEEKLEGKKKEDIDTDMLNDLPIPVTDFLPDQCSDSSMAKINTYKNPTEWDDTKIQTDPMEYRSIGLQKRERSEEKPHEIEEGKKKKMKRLVEHTHKPLLDSRYARTDRVSTPLMHHPQSVDVVAGTMGSLLPKLQLLKDEYNLEAKVKDSVESLHFKLKIMQAWLWELATQEPKRLDEMLNGWARAVRDFSYDVEDAVDSLPLRIEGSRRLITWVTGWFNRKKAHKEIADTINGIRKKAWDLYTLHQRCRVDVHIATHPNAATRDYHRLFPAYENPTELVGIEVPMDEVIWKLTRGTGDVFEQRKIVSIVGMGGLGKTALAKAVYDKIQVQYDYKAFVPMSRDPDLRKVYMDILILVDKQSSMGPTSLAKFNEGELHHKVRRLLANKRYLIVIDDIWDEYSWKVINRALMNDEAESRVVTTTRNHAVANMADDVYRLKALSHLHSKELFNRRLFDRKDSVPSDVSEKILSKCGGVPLAIKAMASLLYMKPRVHWSKVYDNAGYLSDVGGNAHAWKAMREILSSSYYDMPYFLRACLLHLHIFPKDCLIKKETLIWKWAAEGLIVEEPGTGLSELGEGYFQELINRNVVMSVEDDSHSGKVIGCRVHYLVLDIICSLSTQENFVTVLDGSKQQPPVASKTRRLAVQKRVAEQGDPLTNIRQENLRSFNTMGCHFSTDLSLSSFERLRVVAIEECTFSEGESHNLKYLGRLLQLRYLGLYNTRIDELPEDIGDLRFLQTLDLRGTRVKERQLKCLRADEGTAVPDWMGNLTSLEELLLGEVGMSVNFVNVLSKLTELRKLEIRTEKLDKNQSKALVQSMRNLEKIQVLRLTMRYWWPSLGELNWGDFDPPGQLRELHLMSIASSQLPAWINVSRVPILSHLYVNVMAVKEQDLENLGRLPELISLELLTPSNIFPTIKGGRAFPKLRCFHTSTSFSFSEGTMPSLELFHFKVDISALKDANVNFDDGFVASTLKNLPSLQKVEAEISFTSDVETEISFTSDVETEISFTSDVEAIHEALKRAVDEHPNSPSLNVKTN